MAQKYNMVKVTEDLSISDKSFLIMMANDEDRSMELIKKKGDCFETIICLLNLDEIQDSLDIKKQLEEIANKSHVKIHFGECRNDYEFKDIEIEESKVDSSKKIKLNEYLKTISKNHLSIDITSINIAHMCRIMQVIIDENMKVIDVYYCEPENYNYKGSTFTNYEKFNGYIDIKEIQGDVKEHGTNKYYTFLLGFEKNVANRVKEELYPSKFSVVNGFPAYLPKNKDISLINNLEFVKDSKKIYYSTANNPFKTYNVLQSIYDKLDDNEQLCIVPLGTKPMMFAACLFSIIHNDVKLIGVKGKEYKKKTSIGSGDLWKYEIAVD